jgi:TonB family protein
MMELIDALHGLGTWSAGALWVPVLAWTVLAAPLYLVARYATAGRPLHRYRMLQALLLTLPVGLLAAAWVDVSAVWDGWRSLPETASAGEAAWLLLPAQPSATTLSPAATSPVWDMYHGLGLLTSVAIGAAVIQCTRLAWAGRAIAQLRSAATDPASNSAQAMADAVAADLGIRRSVRVRRSDDAVVPLTFGTFRPVILLPRTLAEQPDALRMTLTHELIHVRRYDFLARWTEKLIAAVFAIHPALPWLTDAVASSREMACDAEALRRLQGERKRYADLLFSFSTLATPQPAVAVSIAETSSSLKERIHAMTQFDPADHAPRFASLVAATLLITLGLGVVACSDAVTPPQVEESETDPVTTQAEELEGEVFIVVEDRPELKGGLAAVQEALVYPKFAKKAGIEGRVFVQFVVDENGDVRNPTVTRGVHTLLDQAAVEAVKEMTFKPGKQRGQPVKVQMSLPVTFKLEDESSGDTESSVLEEAGIGMQIRSVSLNGSTLRGQLVDRETGASIGEATIQTRWGDATTDSDGRFSVQLDDGASTLSELPPDATPPPPVRLDISHASYRNATIGLPIHNLGGEEAESKEPNSSIFGQAGMDVIRVEVRDDGTTLVDGQVTEVSDLTNTLNRLFAEPSTKRPVLMTLEEPFRLNDETTDTIRRAKVAVRAADVEVINPPPGRFG